MQAACPCRVRESCLRAVPTPVSLQWLRSVQLSTVSTACQSMPPMTPSTLAPRLRSYPARCWTRCVRIGSGLCHGSDAAMLGWQLKPGGLLMCPVGPEFGEQEVVVARKREDGDIDAK